MTDDAGPSTSTSPARARATCPRDETHLVVARDARARSTRSAASPRGLALVCANRIPHGRGLGSSAAAIVAGLVAGPGAGRRRRGAARRRRAAARSPTELEGHPDNVAACLLGGLTAGLDRRPTARACRLELGRRPAIAPVAFVPGTPAVDRDGPRPAAATVPHADAALNAGRAALLVAALTARPPDLLLAATEDRLHQAYRAPAMPGPPRWSTGCGRPGIAGRRLRCRADRARAGRRGRAPAVARCPRGWRVLTAGRRPGRRAACVAAERATGAEFRGSGRSAAADGVTLAVAPDATDVAGAPPRFRSLRSRRRRPWLPTDRVPPGRTRDSGASRGRCARRPANLVSDPPCERPAPDAATDRSRRRAARRSRKDPSVTDTTDSSTRRHRGHVGDGSAEQRPRQARAAARRRPGRHGARRAAGPRRRASASAAPRRCARAS